MLFRKTLIFALIATLALPIHGQEATAPAAPPAGEQAKPATPPEARPSPPLQIVVVEGEGAKNDIRTGTAVAPQVRVTDDGGKPVPGAEVVFQLPMGGPSGVFNGWVRSQTVRTDEDGLAAATGYTPNEVEGRFNIKVTATYGDSKGSAVIAQSNVKGTQGRSGNKKWWILAIAAGAGVGIGVAAAAGGDSVSSVSASPVVITSGPVTVGGPK